MNWPFNLQCLCLKMCGSFTSQRSWTFLYHITQCDFCISHLNTYMCLNDSWYIRISCFKQEAQFESWRPEVDLYPHTAVTLQHEGKDSCSIWCLTIVSETKQHLPQGGHISYLGFAEDSVMYCMSYKQSLCRLEISDHCFY